MKKNKTQKKPAEKSAQQEEIRFTDGVLDGLDKDFVYLKKTYKGIKNKKIKLSKNVKFLEMILVDEGRPKDDKEFKEKETRKAQKKDFREGDYVSIIYGKEDKKEVAAQLKKVTVESKE